MPTGIQPRPDSIRIYAEDSAVANGEAVVVRSALGQPLRIIDEAGIVVGHAKFEATVKRQAGAHCTHRGEQTGERQCESCKGVVMVKVFACEIHTSCHLSPKPIEGVKMCQGCGEFRPSARPENM